MSLLIYIGLGIYFLVESCEGSPAEHPQSTGDPCGIESASEEITPGGLTYKV